VLALVQLRQHLEHKQVQQELQHQQVYPLKQAAAAAVLLQPLEVQEQPQLVIKF
jgi:hypothetical protein